MSKTYTISHDDARVIIISIHKEFMRDPENAALCVPHGPNITQLFPEPTAILSRLAASHVIDDILQYENSPLTRDELNQLTLYHTYASKVMDVFWNIEYEPAGNYPMRTYSVMPLIHRGVIIDDDK